jgi:hypothetical protein
MTNKALLDMQGGKSNPTQANPEDPAVRAATTSDEASVVPGESEADVGAAQGAGDAADAATQELLENFVASNDVNLDDLFDVLIGVAEGGPDDPEMPVTDGSELAVDALVAESFVTVGDFSGGDAGSYYSLESKILALFDAHDNGTG